MNGFTLKESSTISQPKCDASLWIHNKTKARIVFLKNNDEHRAFTIAFCTPPTNNKGIPHMLEHSVFCGSNKYPLKDPFLQLMKGSLNTFLNAITYSDMTLFPVASTNKKDFSNLCDVYLDAVFNPTILKESRIFSQEGWHYEKDDDDNIVYNGVVFNEMRGLWDDCDFLHTNEILKSLFPNTCYSYVSGGMPDSIVDASYEEMIDFYNEHYHPSNCTLIMYGDNDIEERLNYLDENYLSKYEYSNKCINYVDEQAAFSSPSYHVAYYPAKVEELEKGYMFSYNLVYSNKHDIKEYLTMVILDYCLCSSQGSYIREALLEKGIGDMLEVAITTNIKQPIFSIICNNCSKSDENIFFDTINDTLSKVVKDKLNKDKLHAIIKRFDFHLREDMSDQTSKGIPLAEQLLEKLLYYEEDTFSILKARSVLQSLDSMVDTDYFENFIIDKFINNNHKSMVVMTPDTSLSDKLIQTLDDKKDTFLKKQNFDTINKVIAKQIEYQEAIDEPSVLELIPTLTKADLDADYKYSKTTKKELLNTKIYLQEDVQTNGIGYLSLMFDLSVIPTDKLPYIRILAELIGSLDTTNCNYENLTSLINSHTGGIYHKISSFPDSLTNEPFIYLVQRSSFIYNEADYGAKLNIEVINNRLFDDKSHILDILTDALISLRGFYQSSPHLACSELAENQFSLTAVFNDMLTGYSFYKFLDTLLKDFDTNFEQLRKELYSISSMLFTRDNLRITYIGEQGSFDTISSHISNIINALPKSNNAYFENFKNRVKLHDKKKIAYTLTSSLYNVCMCADVGNIMEQKRGHFLVLEHIINCDYLWQKIRVVGGAYDAYANFRYDGIISFTSYRDPHCFKTITAFKDIANYARTLTLSESELNQYIIGAYNNMTLVQSPVNAAYTELCRTLCNISHDSVVNVRQQIIDTTLNDLISLADYLDAAIQDASFVVVGSTELINQGDFDECRDLLYS